MQQTNLGGEHNENHPAYVTLNTAKKNSLIWIGNFLKPAIAMTKAKVLYIFYKKKKLTV
jgi:hypothetical protein